MIECSRKYCSKEGNNVLLLLRTDANAFIVVQYWKTIATVACELNALSIIIIASNKPTETPLCCQSF